MSSVAAVLTMAPAGLAERRTPKNKKATAKTVVREYKTKGAPLKIKPLPSTFVFVEPKIRPVADISRREKL